MHEYIDFLRNWKNIKGRVDRYSYWMALLVMLIILTILLWLGEKIPFISSLPAFYSVVMIVPYLSSTIRRLHDVNKSGWWVLLFLIPVIGWIGIFIFTIENSKEKIKDRCENDVSAPRLEA